MNKQSGLRLAIGFIGVVVLSISLHHTLVVSREEIITARQDLYRQYGLEEKYSDYPSTAIKVLMESRLTGEDLLMFEARLEQINDTFTPIDALAITGGFGGLALVVFSAADALPFISKTEQVTK